MADLFDNPMGLMGFEFVEFTSPTPGVLEAVFEKLGFTLVAKHRSKDVVLYRQGDINFIVNREPHSPAAYFAAEHGPSACGLAFRVKDSHRAYALALERGAQPLEMPTGPMVADLIGGQVDLGVVALPAVQGHLKSGALRAIGIMGKSRVASMPELPTIAEQGFPDVDVAGWFAMVGPKGLPPAEVKRIHEAVVAAFAMPEAAQAMARQENVISPSTPEAAVQFFRSEQERYARLVKKANIVLE